MVIRGAAPNQENRGITKGGGCSSVSGGCAAAAGGGKSMSSVGSSPSNRIEFSTPASKAMNRFSQSADDAGSPGAASGKKKRAQTAQAAGGGGGRGDNKAAGGRGLRQFSIKVCEKVKAKGRTTYNEVADELVAEFSTTTPDNPHNFEEKNIRRRVYDALNVLMAMDIISKDENKEIIWRGLPGAGAGEELKAQRLGLRNRIANKAAHLQELEEQFAGLKNLIQRNEQLCCSGNAAATPGGVQLPFILVQTRPHATVEVEISEDMQLVHFDFNKTPFELHDDCFVLKSMGFCDSSPKKNDVGTQESAYSGGEGSKIGTSKTQQVNRQLRTVA
ncbi:hypothetical protein MKW92_053840 [Papaver armeniacum]|nr:hypothetical protein MKW92_053840 [Papaver armeniacum]